MKQKYTYRDKLILSAYRTGASLLPVRKLKPIKLYAVAIEGVDTDVRSDNPEAKTLCREHKMLRSYDQGGSSATFNHN